MIDSKEMWFAITFIVMVICFTIKDCYEARQKRLKYRGKDNDIVNQ